MQLRVSENYTYQNQSSIVSNLSLSHTFSIFLNLSVKITLVFPYKYFPYIILISISGDAVNSFTK